MMDEIGRLVVTMMTDNEGDERRKVAAGLRAGGIARNVREAYVLLLHCVGIRPQLPADKTCQEALSRIADLIDPTCHQVLEDETQVCSECGGDLDERYGWNYCPECGCRIVVRGDNDE
ncbi:MAG: hypothetical protein KH372_08555 [Olsenella uli]|uniref:hypothetical protein n=1 Tax=Olsenella uli TaxID=133926 RepID=UPI001E0E03DF|nr:hypothetical protein [Olsenella uli]MBS6418852.1 hypothetical protein [Olsenella uli]